MGLHLIIHCCLTPGGSCCDGGAAAAAAAAAAANGYWVIFSFPGAIMQKGGRGPPRERRGTVLGEMGGTFKISRKCADSPGTLTRICRPVKEYEVF